MQTNTQYTPKTAHPRLYTSFPTWTAPRAASPIRKPQPEGLSQAELRKIVIDMIG